MLGKSNKSGMGQTDLSLTKNEKDFLLRHIADADFSGKDVLILSSIVAKLQGS